jgi:hypothetical protein
MCWIPSAARVGLGLAMDEFSQKSPVLWDHLPPERRRILILTLEGMALHRIRQAPPVIEENSDDERRSRIGSPGPVA